MNIDHICFVVNDLKAGIEYWYNVFGYKQISKIVINSRQKVRVVFLGKKDSITIKLIEPIETNNSLINFINRNGGFHHICFKCKEMNEKIMELQRSGFKMLVPPEPGEAFNNNDIAFLLGKNGLIVELTESDIDPI